MCPIHDKYVVAQVTHLRVYHIAARYEERNGTERFQIESNHNNLKTLIYSKANCSSYFHPLFTLTSKGVSQGTNLRPQNVRSSNRAIADDGIFLET